MKRTNSKGDKIYFYYDLGREKGQRPTTGVFIYAKPKNQIEKNHNKEALLILETKRSQYMPENQVLGSGFIPSHKFKANFIDYFEEYVKLNQRKGNRHLQNTFKHFKTFVKNDFISPLEITENFCKRFRQFLLDHFTGETPADYLPPPMARKASVKKGIVNTGKTIIIFRFRILFIQFILNDKFRCGHGDH